MRLRKLLRQSAITGAVCTATMAFTAPAFAHDAPHADNPARAAPHMDAGARDAWLADCRQRLGKRDNGLGGALIGGLVGGVAGNRIAGKRHRTGGTLIGAGAGALAGMAIDKAEDHGRARDECEAYLADYEARYQQNHAGYGYGQRGYGYQAGGYGGGCCSPMMMVPVMMMPRAEPECTETVEYVYEDVPVRPARRIVPRKRVKVVPDKRIKILPVK